MNEPDPQPGQEPLNIVEAFSRPWNPDSPFSNRPTVNIELEPGKYFDRNNLAVAGEVFRSCKVLLLYIFSSKEKQTEIKERAQVALDIGLDIFQFLAYTCNYSSDEWATIAQAAGVYWKNLDLLFSYELNQHHKSEGALVYENLLIPKCWN